MKKLFRIKRWYSIDDAAERLTMTLGEAITTTDVLRLIADGDLRLFWRIDSEPAKAAAPFCHLNSPLFGIDDGAKYHDEVRPCSGIFEVKPQLNDGLNGWINSLIANNPNYMDPRFPLVGTILEDEDGNYWVKVKRTYHGLSGYFYDDDNSLPTLDEIVITKTEMDRFEAQFVDDGSIDTLVRSGELGVIERASLQKQIASIAMVLAEKSAKYRNGDKPNGNQIAEAVAQILDAMPDANKHGVSSTSMRASIKAGVEMLQGKRGADE